MKLALFANNRAGWRIADWLRTEGEDVVLAVLHPENQQKFGHEIQKALNLPDTKIINAETLRDEAVHERFRQEEISMGISVYFGYIIPEPLITIPQRGIINLHPAYLPYNRGSYPNVWSIVDGTPAGVTIHRIDTGIDTGDILCQKKVPVSPADTGRTLYERLEEEAVRLFQDNWKAIRQNRSMCRPQPSKGGTCHRVRDTAAIDRIDLDRRYRAGELIDILRARTFPPYHGAWFTHKGKRYYINIEIKEEDPGEQS